MQSNIVFTCRTYSFLALMVLLRCPPDQLQQQGQDVLTKFSDLVVKCLIKLTKALQSTLDVGPAVSMLCRQCNAMWQDGIQPRLLSACLPSPLAQGESTAWYTLSVCT